MRSIKLVNSFLAVLLSFTLFNVGCTTAYKVENKNVATVGRKIDMDAINKIQKGVSTQEDVRGLLGSPDTIQTIDGKTTYGYMFLMSAAKDPTYTLGSVSKPDIFGTRTQNVTFGGGMDTQTQVVRIDFDENGVVEKIGSTISALESGWGAEAASRNEGLGSVEDNKRAK